MIAPRKIDVYTTLCGGTSEPRELSDGRCWVAGRVLELHDGADRRGAPGC